MRSAPGTTTVAIRSTRHRRAVPPRRRSTASMPSTRCGWSWLEVIQARNRPECESAPTSTCAFDCQGVSPSSNQHRLALLTRPMINNRGGPTPGTRTGATRRSKTPMAHLPHKRGIALRIAQSRHLVEQHRRPNMRIIGQPLTHIRLELIERIPLGWDSLTWDPFIQQISPDCFSVSTQMTRNSRYRPSPPSQSMNFHVFLQCQHKGQGSSPQLPTTHNQQLGESPTQQRVLAPGSGEFQ